MLSCVPHVNILVAISWNLALLYDDSRIRTLPAILIRPEECKHGLAPRRQGSCRQIEHVNPQPGVPRIGIVRGLPIVDAPANSPWRQQGDAKSFISGHAAGLVVESPAENLADVLFFQVALHGLRRLIENLAVANRTPQLDVLRMRPDQRASRA